jgi:predicted small lipoprotein YifL
MKKTASCLAVLALAGVLAGCGTQGPERGSAGNGKGDDEEAKIQKNLDKLPPEDRKLAEQQKYCAVEQENRLGIMGTPAKVMVKDEPVFLCCSGCKKAVDKDPDKYVEVVKKLREKSGGEGKSKK